MPFAEHEDESRLAITEAQSQFILNLTDTYKTYTRFFSALLISRPSHAAFFRDLRSFRNQAHVIAVLQSCSPASREPDRHDVKQKYLQVTGLYLQSRWSHPWCRTAGANREFTTISSGWRTAEWTTMGQELSRKEQDEEDRLHRLFLPIWVIMRARMFPGDQIINVWWEKKQVTAKVHEDLKEVQMTQNISTWLGKLNIDTEIKEIQMSSEDESKYSPGSSADMSTLSNNPFRAGGDIPLRTAQTTPNLRQEFWNSAEADKLHMDLESEHQQSARAATRIFRLMASGMLLNTIPKWKRRRFLKANA